MSKNTFSSVAWTCLATLLICLAIYPIIHQPCTKLLVWQDYTIQPGDTLWQIARDCGLTHFDVRHVVHLIMEHNNILDAGRIQPGQVIRVPAPRG